MIESLIRFALIALCVLPVWLLIRKPWKHPVPREVGLGLFVMYITALLVMALDGTWASPADMLQSTKERLSTLDMIYLTPLKTIRQQPSTLDTEGSLTQLLGNALLFVPWGFFLPLLWKKFRHLLRIAGMCALLTCLIECTQIFIGRTFDVDDLLLNFLGGMAGAGLWWILRHVRKE